MKHSRLFKCISLFLAAIMLLALLSMILSASFVLPENPIAKASSFPDSIRGQAQSLPLAAVF